MIDVPRQFDELLAVRLDDLKPLSWQELRETNNPEDLVYLVGRAGKPIVIAEMIVCVKPEQIERAEQQRVEVRDYSQNVALLDRQRLKSFA